MPSGPPPGLEALKKRLELSGITLKEAVGDALENAAIEIEKTARFMVPVDTGNLRASIKRSEVKTTEKGNLMIEISAGDETTRVGPGKAQLARIMEWGTRDRRIPAHPFMFPAYRLNKRKAKRLISANMRKVIKVANG